MRHEYVEHDIGRRAQGAGLLHMAAVCCYVVPTAIASTLTLFPLRPSTAARDVTVTLHTPGAPRRRSNVLSE